MAASKPQARTAPRSPWIEWCTQRPAWLLALATVLILLPFIRKPFNIDDPLFVWVAQHIQAHPGNPYGFNVNWYGYDWPLWDITKNPPLACYYLAAVGSLFGWSEIALHVALLLPAIAVVIGTFRLARRLCQRPLLAAFLALFTPVFLVSATTVMCDVLMLAFWIWALVFWVEGTERKRPAYFALAVLMMTLAALTKYFGACVIPLAIVWSIGRKRPVKEWLGWLAFPIVVLIAYQFATRALYGHGLLADAGKYATAIHQSSILLNLKSLLAALTFTGGCVAVMTLLTPFLWSRRELLIGAIISLAVAAILLLAIKSTFSIQPGVGEILQILLWTAGGISLMALTLTDLYRRRNADSILLACWMLGTFIFTAFFNWIVNGRSLLPLIIPAAILVARRLEQRADAGLKLPGSILITPILAGALLAIWVAASDYSLAVASRVAARAVQTAYGNDTHRLWFEGHWGFQYYMEKYGHTALDLQNLQLTEGDRVALPSDNSNVYALKERMVELETFSIPSVGWLTTLNEETGAGFYASMWGPLPFAFGRVPQQTVTVFAYDPTGEIQKAASEKSPTKK
jgi:4-amino-4-deoxy-L-arabinose transferase-like glycosyltransferase